MNRLLAALAYMAWLAVAQAVTVPPSTVEGWRMELVVEAPAVSHPSVVCSAPDGRVFVAEDPMDIRTPSADLTEGRILCLHPGGQLTVFADKLHAVFGMQYLEGRLYVLHNPQFSSFRDDEGIGRDRVDLIAQTNPNPWALDWNDHVPANFRLGVDGYFYVAVGDKGLYGAKGRDGSQVSLHGGGILRLRPDGTELEIYCRGVRNIMDVAINDGEDLFTYDNTDEHDWMGRLTHMVERGFYGYPHDFIPRRPYTLWMMHDFGGGAATGIECVTGSGLPAEYRGNLFLADFGKRQVTRVWTERDGATYRVSRHQEMFPNPSEGFRPVGIAWSADESSLYICDWAHRDEKEDVKVGRLWKLAYIGPGTVASLPSWYVDAAMGRNHNASDQELLAGLEHPSRKVRLTAQRGLVVRAAASGSAAEMVIKEALANRLLRGQGTGRIHALWALDAIDKGVTVRQSLLELAQSESDIAVRRQVIRELGLRRIAAAQTPLAALASGQSSADPSLRFEAATALGRLGDEQAVAPLMQALDQTDLFSRYAAFTALNEIGRRHPDSWTQIASGLASTNARLREATIYALRDTYDEKLLSALALIGAPNISKIRPAAASDVNARQEAVKLIAALHRKQPEWNGEWWAYHPALASPPEKTVEWPGTRWVREDMVEGLGDSAASVRIAAIDGLREGRFVDCAPLLLKRLAADSDVGVRCNILGTLASFHDTNAAPAIAVLISEAVSAEALRSAGSRRAVTEQDRVTSAAVLAAGILGGEACVASLMRLAESPHPGRGEAIVALGRLGAVEAIPVLAKAMRDSESSARLSALSALGDVKSPAAFGILRLTPVTGSADERRALARALGNDPSSESVSLLLTLWTNQDVRVEALEALARHPNAKALEAYLEGLGSANPAGRERCRKAVASLRDQVLSAVESRVTSLPPAALVELRQIYGDHPEAKRGPLFARASQKPSPDDYIRHALTHPGSAVRGQRIFMDEGGVACFRCHAVAGLGGKVGPDLTAIGAQFHRRELADHVLFPSRIVREGYQQIIAETKDGESYSGIIAAETADVLTLTDVTAQVRPIAKGSIVSRTKSQLSLMPEGLHEGLTLEQFTDLMAYLESRKGDPRAPVPKNAPPGYKSLLELGGLPLWKEYSTGTRHIGNDTREKARTPSHWTMKGWYLEHDGVEGDLWTTEEYGDFDLMLEWRWADPPKWAEFPLINGDGIEAGPDGKAATERVLDAGDSGVLFRGLYKAQANLFCYPVGSGEFWEYRTDPNSTPGQRRAFTPKKMADLPIGDWNSMSLRVRGERVTVTVNGEQVIADAQLPGIPARGSIGLQHEHGRIQFRYVWVRQVSGVGE
ncbi:MAG TPA: HEAT repeat domain-containing protein [Candidatus Limnocylindria bacterium]|nr:HEAT repeat domain-containing protein [Candidatus Limnocylindria bacterium]